MKKALIISLVIILTLSLLGVGGYFAYKIYKDTTNKISLLEQRNTQLEALTGVDLTTENKDLKTTKCSYPEYDLEFTIPVGVQCQSFTVSGNNTTQDSEGKVLNEEEYSMAYVQIVSENKYSILVTDSLGRGDRCGLDAGAKESSTCYSSVLYNKNGIKLSKYVYKGKIDEVLGSISIKNAKVDFVSVSATFPNASNLSESEMNKALAEVVSIISSVKSKK